MTRELFQAPHTGTPQHCNDLPYRQARRTRQWVLDLWNTRQEVESQLLSHHLHIIQSQNLMGLALERAWDKVMRIYGRHLETEIEPFWDYLRAIQPEDTDELDVPTESEIKFNYRPETQWTEEEYIRLRFKLQRNWYASETWDDLFRFVVHCLPQTLESHHQIMTRLIAEWCYQQEKGLTWKEWAEGVLDGRPIEGAPQERVNSNRQGTGRPESAVPSWYPPIPEDVLIPPADSASSGSLEENPQQPSDHDPNQGNRCLLNTQLNAPFSQNSTLEDRWTEERQRAVQAVRDITTGQPTLTHEESQMYNWDGQFNETLGLPIQLRNRVSDPGTPPVRVSPRAPESGGGTMGTTANVGSGPELHPIMEDTKGNSAGEDEELLPQQGEDRTTPPTPWPRPRKIQPTDGMVGRTNPQEVHHQVSFTIDEEGPGRGIFAGPWDTGTWEEILEPTPYGPPWTEDV